MQGRVRRDAIRLTNALRGTQFQNMFVMLCWAQKERRGLFLSERRHVFLSFYELISCVRAQSVPLRRFEAPLKYPRPLLATLEWR